MAEYPHYPYHEATREEVDSGSFLKRFKPKVLAYIFVAVAAGIEYFAGFPYFEVVAYVFLAYAVFKLVTCGCWKSQIRTLAALLLVLMASGIVWKPLFSIAVAIMAFEMFV